MTKKMEQFISKFGPGPYNAFDGFNPAEQNLATELLHQLTTYDNSNAEHVDQFGRFLQDVREDDGLEAQSAQHVPPTISTSVASSEPFFRRTFEREPTAIAATPVVEERVTDEPIRQTVPPSLGREAPKGENNISESGGTERDKWRDIDSFKRAKADENTKKLKTRRNHRPVMAQLLNEVELQNGEFLDLQAKVKAFVSDPNHPERERESIVTVGAGNTARRNAAAKMYSCVVEFLTAGGWGERFWGENSPGAADRKLRWPETEQLIISAVLPLMRREITNYRSKLRKTSKEKSHAKNSADDSEPEGSENLPLEDTMQQMIAPGASSEFLGEAQLPKTSQPIQSPVNPPARLQSPFGAASLGDDFLKSYRPLPDNPHLAPPIDPRLLDEQFNSPNSLPITYHVNVLENGVRAIPKLVLTQDTCPTFTSLCRQIHIRLGHGRESDTLFNISMHGSGGPVSVRDEAGFMAILQDVAECQWMDGVIICLVRVEDVEASFMQQYISWEQ